MTIAIVSLVVGCTARILWTRHAEGAAELALTKQGISTEGSGLLGKSLETWLERYGVTPPRGHVFSVSNAWSRNKTAIHDLSPLAAFPRLESLTIRRTSTQATLSLSAQESLAGTSAFPRLRSFLLEMHTTLPDEFFERFSDCPDLEEFSVSNPPLTDGGLKFLASCHKLKSLWIPGCRVHRGLNSLSLTSLESLIALNTPIDSAGLDGLRGCNSLERVVLSGTAVDDAGMEVLAGLPMLAYLHVDRTRVTQAGLERLLKSADPQVITATETSITIEDAVALSTGRRLRIIVGVPYQQTTVNAGATEEDSF